MKGQERAALPPLDGGLRRQAGQSRGWGLTSPGGGEASSEEVMSEVVGESWAPLQRGAWQDFVWTRHGPAAGRWVERVG